jgi:hypothetical protein
MSDALREQPFTVDTEHRKVRSFVLRQGRAGAFVDCLGMAVHAGKRTAMGEAESTEAPPRSAERRSHGWRRPDFFGEAGRVVEKGWAGAKHHGWFA